METNNLQYIGEVMNDGHLSLDKEIKLEMHLKEGDKMEVTLRKIKREKNIVYENDQSLHARTYINYLISRGLKGKALKEVIQKVKQMDRKYDTMDRNKIIKEAYAIAEKRAQTWCQKHGINPTQLTEDELQATIINIRENT